MPALWALGWTTTTLGGIAVDHQFTVFGAYGAITFSALSGLLLRGAQVGVHLLGGVDRPLDLLRGVRLLLAETILPDRLIGTRDHELCLGTDKRNSGDVTQCEYGEPELYRAVHRWIAHVPIDGDR